MKVDSVQFISSLNKVGMNSWLLLVSNMILFSFCLMLFVYLIGCLFDFVTMGLRVLLTVWGGADSLFASLRGGTTKQSSHSRFSDSRSDDRELSNPLPKQILVINWLNYDKLT